MSSDQSYFPVHAHSEFSSLDGMGEVATMARTVADLGQPGLSLTDHGNMAGAIRLYKECAKHQLKAFPGSEFYLVRHVDHPEWREQRFHLGMLALDAIGFRALTALSSRSHQRERFHRKPLIDLTDLSELGHNFGGHVAVTTGCYFGWVVQNMIATPREEWLQTAKTVIGGLALMGFEHVFVEMQDHGIEHDGHEDLYDEDIALVLFEAAHSLGLPVVIGQDSHYCTDMSEPCLMADLSYKPIGDVEVGDQVLGWSRPEGKSNKVATAATVTNVLHREAEAVRITFASGETVICTPDHNWMKYGYWKAGRDVWGPLTVGSEAVRVTYPRSAPPGMEYEAGWLGGMYDGEGSRQGIAQSPTANPETSARIQTALSDLGFNYVEQDNGSGCSVYRIKGGIEPGQSPGGIALWSDFLNITRPTKRKWILDRVINRRFRAIGGDEVVSIEPVGVRTVVSLTTTTGNYVSAGLASKNCDAGHKSAHDMMKSIAYMGGENEDNSFPGDSFHLATTDWLKRFQWSDQQWDAAMAGHEYLLGLNDLVLPELDNYKFHVPDISKDPNDELERMVGEEFAQFDMWGDREYSDRIDEELTVFKEKGFASYFLMMADLMGWCRDEGIFVDARGSANGSLVCYLLGITNVDPIEWDTDFDRFLSLDRDKPPDIDMDIESDRRDDVIEYLRSRFSSLVQIGTWSRLGVHTDEETGEEKGSLLVQYHAAMRRKPGYTGRIPDEHMDPLLALAELDVRKGPGAHAAGFVIPGKGLSIADYLPTMLIPKGKSDGKTVTQAPMGDVEDAGYVKVDLLGQKSLTTMRQCMEMIGKDPVVDGMDWIPNNDREACKILQSGMVGNGIFQFEGFSTAKGARRMGIKSTEDAVIALALFRPAMMDSGMTDEYLAARKAKQRQLIHPSVDDLFDKTWGVPVFQEQVLGLMKRVGLPADERNAILKAVKASNDKIAEYATETFERVYPQFISCAQATLENVDEDDAEAMWATVMKFTDYGFNRAHAVAYGLRAYRTAYLKAHHLTEYMAALLSTWAGVTAKEPQYIKEARRVKMTIRKPEVNGSDVTWTVDRPMVLRKGLLTIKGVGHVAAAAVVEERERNGPYADLDDLCDRVPAKQLTGAAAWKKEKAFKGVLSILRDADALRSLGVEA